MFVFNRLKSYGMGSFSSTTAGVQPEAGSSKPSTMAEAQPEASTTMHLARTKVHHLSCVQTALLAPMQSGCHHCQPECGGEEDF